MRQISPTCPPPFTHLHLHHLLHHLLHHRRYDAHDNSISHLSLHTHNKRIQTNTIYTQLSQQRNTHSKPACSGGLPRLAYLGRRFSTHSPPKRGARQSQPGALESRGATSTRTRCLRFLAHSNRRIFRFFSRNPLSPAAQLDDCTLQVYKPAGVGGAQAAKSKLEADCYGAYLDLDATIDELPDEFDDFHSK